MSRRSLRSNSSVPPIFSIGNTVYDSATTNMTDPNASITTPMSTEEWTTNPFMWTTNSFTRNFNPSTTTGNKTFIEKTKSPADGSRIGDILTFTRLPDGTLNKHKARLCAHGGMQQWGVNYWESYAPVLTGLETKALEFVLAFPQEDLDTPVYMELPIGVSYDRGNVD
eukprot:scaffold27601_cov69-Cyclotella_meneghiniana.AAC.2